MDETSLRAGLLIALAAFAGAGLVATTLSGNVQAGPTDCLEGFSIGPTIGDISIGSALGEIKKAAICLVDE